MCSHYILAYLSFFLIILPIYASFTAIIYHFLTLIYLLTFLIYINFINFPVRNMLYRIKYIFILRAKVFLVFSINRIIILLHYTYKCI